MKLSISRNDYRDKNHIDWKNVCFKEIEVNGLSLLNWYISKGYCYCAIFKHDGDTLRQRDKTAKNFIQTNIISIDLDDRDQTYETFTEIMRGTDIMPSLIYTTANNRIKGNRYRALYVTDNPITSTAEYGAIYDGLVKEIARHTNEPMKDNCGHSVAQQMAGNGTPTFQSTLGDIYCLAELKERYNVNDLKNEDVSSMTEKKNDNIKVHQRYTIKRYLSNVLSNSNNNRSREKKALFLGVILLKKLRNPHSFKTFTSYQHVNLSKSTWPYTHPLNQHQ